MSDHARLFSSTGSPPTPLDGVDDAVVGGGAVVTTVLTTVWLGSVTRFPTVVPRPGVGADDLAPPRVARIAATTPASRSTPSSGSSQRDRPPPPCVRTAARV